MTNLSDNEIQQLNNRINELCHLEPGWLDGEGKAIDRFGLCWCKKIIIDNNLP